MELVLIAILIIVVLAFIASPLRRGTVPLPPTREEQSQSSNALETLIAQRDSTYAAIRDLDFDFQLGKLSSGDYQTLRERYKARAASVLQQIDAIDGKGDASARADASGDSSADARIEEQVAQLRAARIPNEDAIGHK